LFTAFYLDKALGHDVTRRSGRCLPPSIQQVEEKNVKKAVSLSGTTKVAKLVNDSECPDLLAASVDDTKPVHIIFTCDESVE